MHPRYEPDLSELVCAQPLAGQGYRFHSCCANHAAQASASRALFQLNSTDSSAVFTPPAWGRAPEPIQCNNITIEIVSANTTAWPLHAAAPQPLLLP